MSKVALVTGAGSGIGRHTALAFSKAGYQTVVCGRRVGALEETVDMAAAGSGKMLAVVCDVSDPGSVEKMYARVVSEWGRLDVLFNNAGNNVAGANFGELTFEQWKMVMDVNVNGAFLCALGAYKLMRKQNPQGGRIINNGSISAYAPRPGSAPYTTSKHAISGLTKTISLDGRLYNIACGQIDIGNAASDMTAKMNTGVPQADGSIKPEPTMDVELIANAVVNMASLPLQANVQSMTIMATKMPFVGRG